jgi:arginine decarboxylase
MKPRLQHATPLLSAMERFRRSDPAVFTTPGHKAGRYAGDRSVDILGADVFRSDISLLNGIDDRRESNDYRGQAEDLAAQLYGSKKAFFSVNGSSLSVHVALLAVARPGDRVLLARNAHKSMIAATIIAGVKPVFMFPNYDEEVDLAHVITPGELERQLDAHPDVKAVLIVSPDYYGFTADVKRLAELAHQRGIPLVVDEAWGVLFPFHPDFPYDGIHAGADISLGSFHKVLPALSQASIIHVQGDLVDPMSITRALDLMESTSPSSLILASIDGARREMALHGKKAWGRALALAERAREALGEIDGLEILNEESVDREHLAGFDSTKLVIDVGNLGVTGFDAADWLAAKKKVLIELADPRRIMAIITPADDDVSIERLVTSVAAMAKWARKHPSRYRDELPLLRDLKTKLVMDPRSAFFADQEPIPIDEAEGRVAAEMISPYPPGIPAIIPGERFTAPIIQYLKVGVKMGMMYPDAADGSVEKVTVVKKAAKRGKP